MDILKFIKTTLTVARACVKNRKGIEGLPLKYVVIALVASLVIVIAVGMTDILKGGIFDSVTQINNTLAEQINHTLNETFG